MQQPTLPASLESKQKVNKKKESCKIMSLNRSKIK